MTDTRMLGVIRTATVVASIAEPGYVFPSEPQMTMEGGELSVRLEDMILITETG
jgi:Xaa-Pro aminopeptidase